jgi:hypothetical protein
MRRRLDLLIPIVLLSIAVQLLAPIGAFRVVAHAANDPLYLASICSTAGSSHGDAAAPTGTRHDRAGCCAFCGTGLGGAFVIDPPPIVFVSLQRRYQTVSWLNAAASLPTVRVGSNAQARAPPQAA